MSFRVELTDKDRELLDSTCVEFGWTGWTAPPNQVCWLTARCHVCGQGIEQAHTPAMVREGKQACEVALVARLREAAQRWGCVHVPRWIEEGGALRPQDPPKQKKGSMRTSGPRPSENLDKILKARIDKTRGPRDGTLRELGAPAWLLSTVKPQSLGEISPGLVYFAQSLAFPLGLSSERLPELIALAPRILEADSSYYVEIPRLAVLVDTLVHTFAPMLLRSLGYSKQAEALQSLPIVESEAALDEVQVRISAVLQELGAAADFESRAKNLDEALRARAFGYAVISIVNFCNIVMEGYDEAKTIAELRSIYVRSVTILTGVRAVDALEADSMALHTLQAMILPDPTIFGEEMRMLEAQPGKKLRRSVPKAN